MSVERVAIFWVVNASSGEKSCFQFSIPTGSGAGGERGVSLSLKAMWNTMECKRDSSNGCLGGARETHWGFVSHCLKHTKIQRKQMMIISIVWANFLWAKKTTSVTTVFFCKTKQITRWIYRVSVEKQNVSLIKIELKLKIFVTKNCAKMCPWIY